MPVIFGPNNKKFQEAQGLLKSMEVLKSIPMRISQV